MHGMGPHEQVQLQRLPSQTKRQDLVMLFLVFWS
jgi:hypothetical protein